MDYFRYNYCTSKTEESEMKEILRNNVRVHNWYYAHSSNNEVYEAGKKERVFLRLLIEKLHCPFPLEQLRDWVMSKTPDGPITEWFNQRT